MMDVSTDPSIETVTIKCSAQVGKTEILNNIIGYHIDQDPAPMLMIQPTLDMARAWSKDRLAPMVRDSLRLRMKVSAVKSRNSGNEILHKRFPGGHLTAAGANSPASLASRPVRIVLFDEVNRYPASAGTEGDPVNLGKKRAVNFHNRKYILVSTPTWEGASRIDESFNHSDQRRYWLPCPNCGGFHLLKWEHVVWEKTEDGRHMPETAVHVCPHCGGVETDADLPGMLARGEWRAEHPENKEHAGFTINELYSPWVRFSETVRNFLESKDDPELLRVWVNTALGEVWRESKEISTAEKLMERRENYDAVLVPMGGVIITVGVDVQDDRLEWEAVAWGANRENWSLDFHIIPGDPSKPDVWDALDLYLRKRFRHESGLELRILGCGIDTGGHHTQRVYEYCRPRWNWGVFALKGVGGQGKPLTSRPSKNNQGRVNLYQVGVDTAKDMLAANLSQAEHGPGYCHFPSEYDRAYFEQLLAERPAIKRVRGHRVRSWQPKHEGIRNEALDCRVYNIAALDILGVDVNATVAWFQERAKIGGTPMSQLIGNGRRMRSRGVA
jgi:phage terminase large subunit GpA-like protein